MPVRRTGPLRAAQLLQRTATWRRTSPRGQPMRRCRCRSWRRPRRPTCSAVRGTSAQPRKRVSLTTGCSGSRMRSMDARPNRRSRGLPASSAPARASAKAPTTNCRSAPIRQRAGMARRVRCPPSRRFERPTANGYVELTQPLTVKRASANACDATRTGITSCIVFAQNSTSRLCTGSIVWNVSPRASLLLRSTSS